jgi:hypothetical protein
VSGCAGISFAAEVFYTVEKLTTSWFVPICKAPLLDTDSAQEMVMAQDEMGFDGTLAPFDFLFPAHLARSALRPKADITERGWHVC